MNDIDKMSIKQRMFLIGELRAAQCILDEVRMSLPLDLQQEIDNSKYPINRVWNTLDCEAKLTDKGN